MRTRVVIPVYNHAQVIGTVTAAVMAHGLHCILVDDGSTADCARVLDQLAAATPQLVTLLRHPQNRGKGAAVISGMQHAAATGYSHALQIDADASTIAPTFRVLYNWRSNTRWPSSPVARSMTTACRPCVFTPAT